MSELRFEQLTILAADLGPENPLPQLVAGADLHTNDEKSFGKLNDMLPYTVQDGYNRQKNPRAFRTAVLENDILKATFLLEAGGRLWSLYHKPSGRDLLHVNAVFQPANLAIRNAWFSGGVEWNCGIIGHTPFTCAPLFAARAELDDKTPVLRLWEWERIRQATFQMDVFLPDDSHLLYVRVRIVNTQNQDIAMYWWSNIAVDEKPGLRVIAPADSATHFGYTEGLKDTPVPVQDSVDVTYPTNLGRAQDFFYNLPPEQRRYITAVDSAGEGLVQTSTDRLRGRKLFVWGQGTGGRRWQEYLAELGCAYIEIQAGLARTQMDYLRMPAKADWSWLEAYGLMKADPATVHGSDWRKAQKEVEDNLERLVPRATLDTLHDRTAAMADRPPIELLHRGSGWGALEAHRRQRQGEALLCGPALVFDDASLGSDQQPWLKLLKTGGLPDVPPDQPPGAFMVQPQWRAMLEEALASGQGSRWRSLWHLGVMRYHDLQPEAARRAWEDSLQAVSSVWAVRNLAATEKNNMAKVDLYTKACRMAPGLIPLAIEAGTAMMESNQPQCWLDLLEQLNPAVKQAPRIQFLCARAQSKIGDMASVEAFIASEVVVPDIREGEESLSTLWFEMHEKRLAGIEGHAVDDAIRKQVRLEYPPPAHLDFRMGA